MSFWNNWQSEHTETWFYHYYWKRKKGKKFQTSTSFLFLQIFFTYLKSLKQYLTKIKAPKYALFANESFFPKCGNLSDCSRFNQFYFIVINPLKLLHWVILNIPVTIITYISKEFTFYEYSAPFGGGSPLSIICVIYNHKCLSIYVP